MFKRLQILIGIVVGWMAMAFTLPKIFLVVAIAIIGAAVWHMMKEKKRHSAGMFFSSVGAFTAAIAALGWLAEPDYEDYADEAIAAQIAEANQALAEQDAEEQEAEQAPAEEIADADEGGAVVDDKSTDEQRTEMVAEAISNLKKITKGKGSCTDPAIVAESWNALSAAQATDDTFKQAKQGARQLEKCRKKMLTSVTRELKKTGIKARTELAKAKQTELADKNAKIKTSGPGKTKLVIRIKGISQEDIDALSNSGATDSGLLAEAQDAGFKQVQIAGGKKPANFKLSPTSEADIAKSQLEEHGLAEPLIL